MGMMWSESREDRAELRPCTICDAVDGACTDCGFMHVGRRWEIGITWPGSRFDGTESVLAGCCQATVEDLHVCGAEDRHLLFYRGACVGCGWASEREHLRDSNLALEDALDHVLPDWRRVPIVERFGHDGSSKQRARWFDQVAELYVAHGFEDRYAPGAGGLIRTRRRRGGTRSHCSVGFYDVSAGVVEVAARSTEERPVQLGLF